LDNDVADTSVADLDDDVANTSVADLDDGMADTSVADFDDDMANDSAPATAATSVANSADESADDAADESANDSANNLAPVTAAPSVADLDNDLPHPADVEGFPRCPKHPTCVRPARHLGHCKKVPAIAAARAARGAGGMGGDGKKGGLALDDDSARNLPAWDPVSAQASPKTDPIKRNHPACDNCGTVQSPQWRKGPAFKPMLCNACGIRYKTTRKLEQVRLADTAPSLAAIG
jgi:hypothetical protein